MITVASPTIPRRALCFAALIAVTVAAPVLAAAPQRPPVPAWVEKSNAHSQHALEMMARYVPEMASRFGVPGFDEQVMDMGPNVYERNLDEMKQGALEFERRLQAEQDPLVKQDLEILINATRDRIASTELARRTLVPYFNVTENVFQGLRVLLDDQVPAERRKAALVRLRRYAGMEKGSTPIAVLAEQRTRERLAESGLLGPARAEIERDLANQKTFVDGIGALFAKYGLKGYEKPYAALKTQLATYDAFVRAELLPRARTDFRLPPELYADQLKQFGVDMSTDELQSRAKVAFKEIQSQMQALAPRVAREKGFTATDYRDVIRELKKGQLVGDAILAHYQARIKEIEELIRKEQIVTLPDRPMQIVLASEAESASIPAPNMRPPRMIGNTGEIGSFVLPLRIPAAAGQKQLQFDDFTFEAASWTLTAHEGRPGHELQFAAVIEKGVSTARAMFAFNSVNVEGWGLYAEAELLPYEPAEGQLIALQHRLLRAARAYLDPGLQLGTVTPEEATRILREEVVMSEAMAHQEVQRYTVLAPGQATSYFVGYSRLLELRADAERALGSRFDRRRFNDFVLAQGLLPPKLLRAAVTEGFVAAELGTAER